MSIYEKLQNIQCSLVAPKSQYNSFGKYKYRSCEDIVGALTPLLKENKCCLTMSDDIVLVGERYYVKATATLVDEQGSVSVSAMARESLDKRAWTGRRSQERRPHTLGSML